MRQENKQSSVNNPRLCCDHDVAKRPSDVNINNRTGIRLDKQQSEANKDTMVWGLKI